MIKVLDLWVSLTWEFDYQLLNYEYFYNSPFLFPALSLSSLTLIYFLSAFVLFFFSIPFSVYLSLFIPIIYHLFPLRFHLPYVLYFSSSLSFCTYLLPFSILSYFSLFFPHISFTFCLVGALTSLSYRWAVTFTLASSFVQEEGIICMMKTVCKTLRIEQTHLRRLSVISVQGE